MLADMDEASANMLLERGLLVSRLPGQPHDRPPRDGTFTWVEDPSHHDLSQATFYIDGSAFYAELGSYHTRCGFSIVVVTGEDRLLGAGRGVPPSFVNTSAAAELWALYQLLLNFPFIPRIVTDCKGILDSLDRNPSLAVGPLCRLARIWKLIIHTLDSDNSWQSLRDRIVWMPSHTTRHGAEHSIKSNGLPVTLQDWRANRLADGHAKAAAAPYLLARIQLKELRSRDKLTQKILLRIGKVTYAANHHKVERLVDGVTQTVVLRDSNPPRASRARKPHAEEEAADAQAIAGASAAGALIDLTIDHGPSAAGGPSDDGSPRDGAATPAESACNDLITNEDPPDVVRPGETETTQLVRLDLSAQTRPGRDTYGTYSWEFQRKYRRLHPHTRPPRAARGRSVGVVGSPQPERTRRPRRPTSHPPKRPRLQPRLTSRRAQRLDDSAFFDSWEPRHVRSPSPAAHAHGAESASSPVRSSPCGERSPEQLGTHERESSLSILPVVQWHGITIDQSSRSSPIRRRSRPTVASPVRPSSPRVRSCSSNAAPLPAATRRRLEQAPAPRIRGDLYIAGLSELPSINQGADLWLPDPPVDVASSSLVHWRRTASLTPLHLRSLGAHQARTLPR